MSNPAYLGVWEAKKIANPEYEDDYAVYKYADFGFIGFDLWQVKGDTIIDNVIIQYQAKYEEASRVQLCELVKLIPESISKKIEKQVQGIFPLKDTLIRKLKIRKKPKFDIAKLMEMHGDGGDDEAGVAGGFLQTPTSRILQQVVAKSDLPETDQEEVTAFLSQSNEYAPQSGEIIGILKQMGDTMATTLAALSSTIESKTRQIWLPWCFHCDDEGRCVRHSDDLGRGSVILGYSGEKLRHEDGQVE